MQQNEDQQAHNSDSILGRNTLRCCSHFGWKFDDFVCGNIDLSNGTLLRRHHERVNSCDWHTVQFSSEIINVRDDVFGLHFSDCFTLSCQELNTIVLFLATDTRQADLNYCILVLYCKIQYYIGWLLQLLALL